ncbi:MAG: cation transporter [Bacteroidetes bacterium]|nr:MAG: cation transporter [Bacteroidota bacterium]
MSHNHPTPSGKNLGITIILNVVITVAQFIGGIISGSMALISDATHNFSDVLSLIISYIANRLSKKKATEEQTFGLRRSEIMAAFFNSTTLIFLSVFILYEAIGRLMKPPQEIAAEWVIYLALLSIAANGLSVLLIKNDAKGNINMRSAYLHLFSDMLTSIAVLAGGLAMKYFQWYWVDSVFSIAIAIYLLYMSWDIFKTSIRILMQYTPKGIDVKKIIAELEKVDGVSNLHHVHIWQINDHEIMFESHVDMEEDIHISDFEKILDQMNAVLKQNHILHATLQPEYGVNDSKDVIHNH